MDHPIRRRNFMNDVLKSVTVKRWFKVQRRSLLSAFLILFWAFVLGDIVIELLAATTGRAYDSVEAIFNQMRSSGYWARKLVFSFGGAILYGAVLWYLKGRTYSKNSDSVTNDS